MAPDFARSAPMSIPTSPSLPPATRLSDSFSSRLSLAELSAPPRASRRCNPSARIAAPQRRRRRTAASGAARSAPELLVELERETYGQVIAEDPLGERGGRKIAGHRREVHRAAVVELALAHEVARPLVVRFVGDHQLELVGGAQQVEVGPVVALRLARAGALDVDDLAHARVDWRDVDGTARLEQHIVTRVAQLREEGQRPRWQRRPPAGELDGRAAEGGDARQDLGAREPLAFVERVLGVGPATAAGAAGGAEGGAGQDGE